MTGRSLILLTTSKYDSNIIIEMYDKKMSLDVGDIMK